MAEPAFGAQRRWDALRSGLQAQRARPPITAAAPGDPVPASFAQQRLWFLDRLSPGDPQHNLTIACRLAGRMHAPALARAFGILVARHAILRTSFAWDGTQLLQQVHADASFAMTSDDLRDAAAAAAAREAIADAATTAQAQAPFDTTRPPLLRARLLRLADAEHRLVLTVHHLVFDGWSFEVFMGELAALYGALSRNRDAAADAAAGSDAEAGADADAGRDAPVLQYADFAAWQCKTFDAAMLAPQLEHWTRVLAAPLPVLRVPMDRPRALRGPRRGATLRFGLSPALTAALAAVARAARTTPFTLLLTGFTVLLHRITGDDDIIVGTPVAQRNDAALVSLIGPVLNTLVLRSQLSGGPSFREQLARTDAVVGSAMAHSDLPFEQLVDALGLQRRADAPPLVQAMFAFQNLPPARWRFTGLDATAWSVQSGSAPFELTLYMWEKQGSYGGELVYDTGLFEACAMERLLESFETLLEAVARSPDTPIARLPLLGPRSWAQLRAWNAMPQADPPLPHPQKPGMPAPRAFPDPARVHAVFEARAANASQATALVRGNDLVTYAELAARASRLAALLMDAGAAPGRLVALHVPSGPDFIAAALAVLKTGAAYVPVAPDEPAPHAHLLASAVSVRCDDTGALAVIAPAASDPPAKDGAPAVGEDVACVLFTSGSTGMPKGVCVTHRGLLGLACNPNYAALSADRVFLQLAPVTFDAASFEIWGALLNGATLAIPDVTKPSLADIAAALHRHRVDTLWLTSGLFELLVDRHLDDLRGLRQLLTGGDVMSPAHARRFMAAVPGCTLVNCYGPTENTTFTTFCRLTPALLDGTDSVPIGRPVSGAQVWLLDAAGEPAWPGAQGEAWLGGDGVMAGWLGDPAGTAQALAADRSGGRPGGRLYRSGDLMRLRSDGELLFVGRTDRQVKLNGYRIEPAGVEQVLMRHPDVRQACVVLQRDAPGGPRLVAHVVGPALHGAALHALRSLAQAALPSYARPSAYVHCQSLPLDRNGKIDRQVLARHAVQAAGIEAYDAAASAGGAQDVNPTADAVADAFARTLQSAPVGIDDSFFDLGGHSMLALRLLDDLESALARKVPLVLLFKHPTPRALAAALDDAEAGQAGQHTSADAPQADPPAGEAIPLRSGAPGPALFIVPGGHGGKAELTLYARMLAHSATPMAAWGLPARGLDGLAAPHADVKAMASDYVATVRRIQPSGPWWLAGECVGGPVAYEMARQMRAAGDAVSLILLDSWCPGDAGERHYWTVERPRSIRFARWQMFAAGVADLAQVARAHLRAPLLPPFTVRGWLRYAIWVGFTLLRVSRAWLARIAHPERPAPGGEAAAAAARNYVVQAMRYRPAPCAVPAAMVVTLSSQRHGLVQDWARLLSVLAVRQVPGNHLTYLREQPRAAAAAFDECLAALRPGQGNIVP